MLIDLHVHIWPHSVCSNMKLEETILQAKLIGLDGICLTDHSYIWNKDLVERYREEFSFRIFRGVELASPHGHFLIFGAEKIPTIFSFSDLEIISSHPNYFCILAHPFRFLTNYRIETVGSGLSDLESHRVLKAVNAVEIYNGSNSEKDNSSGETLAQVMALKTTGGSDAHALNEIGQCYTRLEKVVETEQQLIEEFKAGRFQAVKGTASP